MERDGEEMECRGKGTPQVAGDESDETHSRSGLSMRLLVKPKSLSVS